MFKKLLKQHNISVTEPRIHILEILKESGEPVTIDYIQKKLEISINQTTLYRSLKKFVDKGIIYQTDFREGVAYFEYHGKNHHHHISCISCKKRQSIDMCPQNFTRVEKSSGFVITNHMFELFGLCENCL